MTVTNDRLEAVFAAQNRQIMVDIARDVIEIPSPTGEEGLLAEYLAQRYAELGLTISFQEVETGRHNVLARLSGSGDGPTLMFLAHMDTSTTPDEDLPYGFQARATLEDGWLFGLGISNMKCAFAGFYSAIQMLQDAEVELPGDLVIASVVGEIEKAPVDEWQGKPYRGGGSGARFMVNHGETADFCINGEPTGLRLQVGNAGYIFARVHIAGSPQATFSRSAGIDPIPKAHRVAQHLRQWEQRYQELHQHSLMKPLISVGAIYGGYPFKPSLTAPFCNLYLHITTIPGQSILGTKRELEEALEELIDEDPELDVSVAFYLASNGHELDPAHPGAQAVERASEAVLKSPVIRPEPERYSISSDNSPLAEFGIPGITYGAGGINRSGDYTVYEPGIGEVVGLNNLAACSRVYAASAMFLMDDWQVAPGTMLPHVW